MEDGSVMPSANCLNVFLCNAEIQQSADKFPTKCILPHLAVEKTVELCKGDHNVEFKYQAGLNICTFLGLLESQNLPQCSSHTLWNVLKH